MKLFRVWSIYTVTPLYKDRHMKKFKRVMKHIKLISMYPGPVIQPYIYSVLQSYRFYPTVLQFE
jgi:hypothetical protein